MSALQERQVKPIYGKCKRMNALETGSLKAALQACNKLLKKQPASELVKSLKALTLARAGKAEESSSLCDQVLVRKPTEDIVLAALSHSLRALGRHEDVTAMYDEAFKKQPGNEELGAQTFMANTKISNWKTAQQVSTRMHKTFKDDRFLYWSIMSAVLQANDPHTPAATRSMLFGLSLRLIETANTQSVSSPDRFYLHLSILFEMGRLAEAQKLLSSPAGQRLCATSLVIDEVRAQVAVKLGIWKAEGDLARQRLEGVDPQQELHEEAEQNKKDRNWLTYLSLLDATFRKQSEFSLRATMVELNRVRDPKEVAREKQLEDEDKAERERVNAKLTAQGVGAEPDENAEVVETLEERVHGTHDVLERLADTDGQEERGSLLALLELERRVRDESDMTPQEGAYVRLLGRYLHTFGSKPSCYEDLRPYVTSLAGAELTQWRAILDDVPVDTSTESNLRRLSNSCKLRRVTLCPEEITIESELESLQQLIRHYHNALPLGKALPKTDLQPADDLAVLVGEVFVSLWSISNDPTHISNAAIFLESALTRSKHNYQFRLMLIRLYRLLGGSSPCLALEHYRTLNPKQMQTDTLSHLILSRAATFSLAAIGDLTMPNECLEASQIYASNSTETAEMIARAFQHEKYSQVQDFILFEDRLDNSLQRDLTKMEHVRMRLTHEPAVPETIDVELLEFRFIFDRIHHDNRDFSILPDHQPKGQSFDTQTVIGGIHPAFGWLEIWLKIYVRALSQASDYDENAPDKAIDPLYLKLVPQIDDKRSLEERLKTVGSAELDELTPDEKSFFRYTTALAEWLEPHHTSARRPKTAPTDSSLTKSNGSSHTSSNGTDSAAEAPAWKDPPEIVSCYFQDAVARLEEVSDVKKLPWESLHVAQLAQEAFVLFGIQTTRFKAGSKRKGDPLPQALKSLRSSALTALKSISDILHKLGEREGGVEKRGSLTASAETAISQINHDFAFEIAKKTTDARKRIFDGMAKGLIKISTTHSA
ncbi:N-acetyltransferase B complex non catalytic subunit-domain-containing protein [Gautieria morchelliformis]|nr:N-acetyltransferase B complex non catalytic subunit-domain-containing protein [Gautieria morchelliformis]